jgi:hypothetical protein
VLSKRRPFPGVFSRHERIFDYCGHGVRRTAGDIGPTAVGMEDEVKTSAEGAILQRSS